MEWGEHNDEEGEGIFKKWGAHTVTYRALSDMGEVYECSFLLGARTVALFVRRQYSSHDVMSPLKEGAWAPATRSDGLDYQYSQPVQMFEHPVSSMIVSTPSSVQNRWRRLTNPLYPLPELAPALD